MRVAIDEATEHNGPLQIPTRPGQHRAGVYAPRHGVLDPAVEEAVGPWQPVLVSPGDLVLFDSFLPHRSQTNLSDTWRRSAYLTYNMASEGDLHAAYYQKKLSAFREGVAGDISINKDFGGEIVRGVRP